MTINTKEVYLLLGIVTVVVIIVTSAFILKGGNPDDEEIDSTPGIKVIEIDPDEPVADEPVDFIVRVVGLPESHTVILQSEVYNGTVLYSTGSNQMDEDHPEEFTTSVWMMDNYHGYIFKYRVVAYEGVVHMGDYGTPVFESEWESVEIP